MRAQPEEGQQHDREQDPRRVHARRPEWGKSPQEKPVALHVRPALSVMVSAPAPVPSRPAVGNSALALNARPLIVVAALPPKVIPPSHAGSDPARAGTLIAVPLIVPAIIIEPLSAAPTWWNRSSTSPLAIAAVAIHSAPARLTVTRGEGRGEKRAGGGEPPTGAAEGIEVRHGAP